MRGRNELAGRQTVVLLSYACGIWVTKPITFWAEKIMILNNNPFNAPSQRKYESLENVNKICLNKNRVKFHQKTADRIRKYLIISF